MAILASVKVSLHSKSKFRGRPECRYDRISLQWKHRAHPTHGAPGSRANPSSKRGPCSSLLMSAATTVSARLMLCDSIHLCITTNWGLHGVGVGVVMINTVCAFFRFRVLQPLLQLLRGGITPRRLAWSLALGIVVGINPSVGLTTLLVITLAWVFGLNQVASQIGVHAVAPLHLLLFVPFIEVGVHLFHTRQLPMDRRQLEHLSHHPVKLIHAIWKWEWHALIVWGVVAAVLMPLIAMYLRRGLVLLMRRNPTLIRTRPTVGAIE